MDEKLWDADDDAGADEDQGNKKESKYEKDAPIQVSRLSSGIGKCGDCTSLLRLSAMHAYSSCFLRCCCKVLEADIYVVMHCIPKISRPVPSAVDEQRPQVLQCVWRCHYLGT